MACSCLYTGNVIIQVNPDCQQHQSVYDRIVKPLERQARKHDLGENYAEKEINKLSNIELLQYISAAIQDSLIGRS